MGIEGVKAVTKLKKINIKTNVHLIFSVSQAVLAAEAGADYLCPLIGRLHDIGGNGIELIENIVKVIRQYKYHARIMASSIRSQEDVTNSLLCGVDAITIPPAIIEKMFSHSLTSIGEQIFKKRSAVNQQCLQYHADGKRCPSIKKE
jgi:transaldolase